MSIDSRVLLSVEIPVVGDGFPSSQDIRARNAIMTRLERGGIGQFVGAGGGLGSMDFAYVVTDETRGRNQIAAAIAKHLPGASYTIERGSADDVESDDGDDDERGSINWPLVLGALFGLGAIFCGIAWLLWRLVA